MKNLMILILGVTTVLTSCGITKNTTKDTSENQIILLYKEENQNTTSDIKETQFEFTFIVDTTSWSLPESIKPTSVKPTDTLNMYDTNLGYLFYNRTYIIPTSTYKNNTFKARTKFENYPDQIVYLDSTYISFKPEKNNNTMVMTVFVSSAPIVPITIEVYEDNKLIVIRDFEWKSY
jgi:hypothetical protein